MRLENTCFCLPLLPFPIPTIGDRLDGSITYAPLVEDDGRPIDAGQGARNQQARMQAGLPDNVCWYLRACQPACILHCNRRDEGLHSRCKVLVGTCYSAGDVGCLHAADEDAAWAVHGAMG